MMCRCAGYRYAGLVAVLACLIWMALTAVAVKFAGPDGAAGMGVSLHSSMDKLFEYLWHKQQVPAQLFDSNADCGGVIQGDRHSAAICLVRRHCAKLACCIGSVCMSWCLGERVRCAPCMHNAAGLSWVFSATAARGSGASCHQVHWFCPSGAGMLCRLLAV